MDETEGYKDFMHVLDNMGPENVMGLWNMMMQAPKPDNYGMDAMFRTVGVGQRGSVTVIHSDKQRESYGPSSSDSVMKMEAFQCPFNWKLVPMATEDFRPQEQLLFLSEPAWDNVCCRIGSAYSLILDGELERARAYLVQLYMILLDRPYVYAYRDDSLRKHKLALKHVVDAMWIWYFLIDRCGNRGLKVSNYTLFPEVERLIEKVTPFDSFSSKHKAAIYVLHCSTGHPTLQRVEQLMGRALQISSQEAAWHCLEGWGLQQLRLQGKKTNIQAEIKALEKSVRIQRNPDNIRILAHAYLGLYTPEGFQKAKQLTEESLEKWPKNVSVLSFASTVYLDPKNSLHDFAAGLGCLKRAASIVGEIPYLKFQLGSAYFLMGKFEEAEKYLKECQGVVPEAVNTLNKIQEMGLVKLSGISEKKRGKNKFSRLFS